MKSKFLLTALSVILTVPAHALTINLINAGGAAPVMNDTGTLTSIMSAAKQVWEAAYADPHTVTITYSWDSLSGGTLGVHSLGTQGGTPNRETAGTLRFDNSGTTWFADSTPFANSEYSTYTESTADFGGGTMNTGRVFTGASGLASGAFDLFSVAMHEVGHALGLSGANTSFIAGNGDLDVDVTAPRAFAGSQIPTVSGAHLNIGTALMFPTFSSGIRRCPSAADVVSNAQISQFTDINYHPCGAVPEPATMAALGLGGLALIRRRRKA